MKNEKKSTVDRVTDAGDANFPGGAPSRTPLQRRKKGNPRRPSEMR